MKKIRRNKNENEYILKYTDIMKFSLLFWFWGGEAHLAVLKVYF